MRKNEKNEIAECVKNFKDTERELKKLNETQSITWSFSKNDDIPYFDVRLSYELTGYRPINETQGLDFKPEWFTKAREIKKASGRYCSYPKGSKAYADFWNEEYRRCRDGFFFNGYTLSGHNYFFLNYYKLPNLTKRKALGDGRPEDYPEFFVAQYEYFHYIELCRVLGYNAVGLKGRGLGFSEIGASLSANTYTCRKNSRVVIAAQQEAYVSSTIEKCWLQLNNLNQHTEGGFKKLRQKHNSEFFKRASNLTKEGNETGWMSEIEGITADKPNKIRGDRTDILLYEESGSWPNWMKAFIQGDALVFIQGIRFGMKLGWGTGGDSGPALAGLSKAYYDPSSYDILKFRHCYTENGENVETAYFIPAYSLVNKEGYIDHRGYTSHKLGKEYYNEQRIKKMNDPKALLLYSAEYCFTAEEALALEGENDFNTVLLAEQLAAIKLHKIGPKIEIGNLEYKFNGEHTEENKAGFRWTENVNGKIHILEHPIKNEAGNFYKNLYVAGIDSIDLGEEDTSNSTKNPSEFCIVIKKRALGLSEPKYVAYYKDRPTDIREAYRIALKMLEYYNAMAVLEATKISLLTFFREHKKENKFLMRRPRATLSDTVNGNSKAFGSPATETIIKHQLGLIGGFIEDYCHTMWFEEWIEEAIKYSYSNKRKFDMIAATGMCELGDEELSGIPPKDLDAKGEQWTDFGYYYDEYGRKKYGAIKKEQVNNIRISIDYDSRRTRSSRPTDD